MAAAAGDIPSTGYWVYLEVCSSSSSGDSILQEKKMKGNLAGKQYCRGSSVSIAIIKPELAICSNPRTALRGFFTGTT